MLTEELKSKIRKFCGKNCESMKAVSWDDVVFSNFFLIGIHDGCRLEALEYAASLCDDPLTAFDCPVGLDLLTVHYYAEPNRLWLDTVIFLMEHGADPFKPDEDDETCYAREDAAAAYETNFEQNAWRSNCLRIFTRLMEEFSEGRDNATIDFPDKVIGQKLRAASIVTDEGADQNETFENGCLIPKDGAVILEFERDALVFCARTGDLFCDSGYREKYRRRHEAPLESLKGMVGRRLGEIFHGVIPDECGFGWGNRFGLAFEGDGGDSGVVVFDSIRLPERKYRDRICLENHPEWMAGACRASEYVEKSKAWL